MERFSTRRRWMACRGAQVYPIPDPGSGNGSGRGAVSGPVIGARLLYPIQRTSHAATAFVHDVRVDQMCSCTFDLLWEVIRYVEQCVQVPVEQGLSVGLLHIKFQDQPPGGHRGRLFRGGWSWTHWSIELHPVCRLIKLLRTRCASSTRSTAAGDR